MKTFRLDIYLGNKHKDTFDDVDSINAIKDKIADFLRYYEIGFSITNHFGGYIYKNKTYATEDSIKISLIGNLDRRDVNKMVRLLKTEFNQETVLVTRKQIEVDYNKDSV